MADNFTKLWLQKTGNQQAVARAEQALQSMGRALPCRVVSVSGSIVTVAFEVDSTPWTLPNITIPKAESQWIRTPTQVGDFGITVPSDVYLGGVSGLGGGVATMANPGNLSALVFVPIANKAFSSVNTNAAYIAGPEGAVIQTQDGSSSITVNESGITMKFGGKTVVLDGTGFTIDGILFDTHVHGGVQTGAEMTLGPQA